MFMEKLDLDKVEVTGGTKIHGHEIESPAVDQYDIKVNTTYGMVLNDDTYIVTVLRVYEESWGCGTRRKIDYITDAGVTNSSYVDFWGLCYLYNLKD